MAEQSEIWIDADAELLEDLGREAQLADESLEEFIEGSIRRRLD